MSDGERAVSTVIGVVLMVGIVVGLAAVVGVMIIGLGSDEADSTQAGPYFGTDLSGTVVTEDYPCDEDVIGLTMQSGDPVDVENLELIVETDIHSPARLDMPIDQESGFPGVISGDEIEGNTALIDQSSACQMEGPILESTENRWTAGETIYFRVPHSAPDPDISPGDEIEVTLVDTEQGTVVQEWELTATDNGTSSP